MVHHQVLGFTQTIDEEEAAKYSLDSSSKFVEDFYGLLYFASTQYLELVRIGEPLSMEEQHGQQIYLSSSFALVEQLH